MDAWGHSTDEDSIGAAQPAPPAKPRDPERTKRLLLMVVAAASVATAVGTGLVAWQVREQRNLEHDLYCANYSIDYETGERADYDDLEEQQQAMIDLLDCDVPGR